MSKLVSIITINFNNKNGLKETINSVLMQTFKNYEYIIIDGASNDGSINEIRKNESHIDYWKSEPDNGIYNAMNKGLLAASGEYIQFLNSGDVFTDDTVLSEFQKLKNNADIIHGYIAFKNDRQKTMGVDRKITKLHLCSYTIKHPGSFVKKSLFDSIGSFDETFLIAGDYDFFLRAVYKYNASTQFIDCCVARFDVSGISNSNDPLMRIERKRARRNNIESMQYYFCAIINTLRTVKHFIFLKITKQ